MRASVGLVAGAAVTAALAGRSAGGSIAPQYTESNNPCVTSRLANGDWQQQVNWSTILPSTLNDTRSTALTPRPRSGPSAVGRQGPV